MDALVDVLPLVFLHRTQPRLYPLTTSINEMSIPTAVWDVLSAMFRHKRLEDDERVVQNLIAIASRGYKIQSQILSIPDRWGFFSKDSRDLHIKEAFLLVALIILKCYTSPLEAAAINLGSGRGSLLILIGTLRALDILTIAFFWAASNRANRSRVKVRKD